MNLKKPKFWDYSEPCFYSYLLWPISILIKFIFLFKLRKKIKKKDIKTICIGNIYLGGTGKTSLAIKINDILKKKNIKTCFVKKYYRYQIDEQILLKNNGILFCEKNRIKALNQAVKEKYEVAIFDDGLQDHSINFDTNFICFNSKNWIGNGMTIPSGPLRQDLNSLKNYNHIFINGNSENYSQLEKSLLNINPKMTIHKSRYKPTNLHEFELSNNFLVFSGIGNHNTFISMLKEYEFKIIKDFEFPDHYLYKDQDLEHIMNLSKKHDCKILTTEKDYHRLDRNKIKNIKVVKSELLIEDEKKLIETILD